MAVEWSPAPVAILCPIAPPCGRLTAELECLGSSYTHTPQHQQQMGFTNLEQQDYDMDPFRQGLTPPQMPGDHMHPYGKCLQGKSNVWFVGLCPSVFQQLFFLSRFQGPVPWDRPSVSYDWQRLSASGGLLPSHSYWPPLLHARLLLHLLRMSAGGTSLIHSASLDPVPFIHCSVQEIRARKVWAHCDNMQ